MGRPFIFPRGDFRPAFPRAHEMTIGNSKVPALCAVGLILVALALRIYALGRLPGVNADEAWYGIAALEFVNGGRFGMVTPNGNLIGPLQFGELVLLHLFFEPSGAVLRVPSLLSSVGAIALAYLAGRRIGGASAAWLAMLIMAVLPINIAYARLGWDPSHSGLLILLATCLLLGGSRIGSAVVFAGALMVHPTNLFAAPFLLLLRAGQAFEEEGDHKIRAIRIYAIMLLAVVAFYYAIRAGSDAMTDPSQVARRLVDLGQYAEFARLFGDLLTGETVYLYLVGKGMGSIAAPLAWLTIGLLALLLLRGINFRRFDLKQAVLLGWVASLGAFFILAGPIAIRPHFERYGFVLIAPTALAMAVMVAPYAARRWFQWLAAATASAALAGFLLFFVLPLSKGTDEAHRSFRTGPVEPKAAAATALRSLATKGPIEVLPEDYWLHLPVDYLLQDQGIRLRWRPDEPALDASGAPHAYWLVWSDSETERRVRAAGLHRLVWASEDPRGRQVRIWQPK